PTASPDLVAPPAAATCSATLSLHDALPISKGGVNTATTRALASSRNTTAEWSMVESPPGSSTRSTATPKSAAIGAIERAAPVSPDRKSTRLNSSHLGISYAVFCLKKKTQDE